MEFEELYSKYRKFVRREIVRWGVWSRDVEDVEQSAWMQISQSFHKYDFTKPSAYIYRCLRNDAGDALRTYFGMRWESGVVVYSDKSKGQQNTVGAGLFQETNDSTDELDTSAYVGTVTSVEDDYFAKLESDTSEFWAEVDKLDDTYSLPITLRYYNEMLPAAIAEKTGMTPKQVAYGISTGIDILRQKLNPGQESYPSARLPNVRKHRDICTKNLHPFNEDNLPQIKNGVESCRICKAVADHKRFLRKKDENANSSSS